MVHIREAQETNDNNVFEDIKKRLTPVACCDCVAAHSENQGGGRRAAQTHRWRAAASVWWRTLFLLLSSSWKSFFQIQISPLSSFHPHAAENRVCVCVWIKDWLIVEEIMVKWKFESEREKGKEGELPWGQGRRKNF